MHISECRLSIIFLQFLQQQKVTIACLIDEQKKTITTSELFQKTLFVLFYSTF